MEADPRTENQGNGDDEQVPEEPGEGGTESYGGDQDAEETSSGESQADADG